MKDELIKFETAKLAKEKGFKEITNRAYKDFPGFIIATTSMFAMDFKDYNSVTNNYWNISAPTQSLLQKWLRDHKGIIVEAKNYFSLTKYSVAIHIIECGEYVGTVVDSVRDVEKRVTYASYEQALEKGLQEALKLITTPLQECNSK